ncbi:MAG: hypothetical protein KHW84_20310 [Enterobacter cloacae]|jgi:hypothetical protein|nr:hypothetical protein [Kosakonia cowanii]MBS5775358.1 hypothetical protein [Enterobacter cloacae]
MMKNEHAIIGEAIIALLSTHAREKFSRKMLEDYLKALYLEKYESSCSVDEIDLHLSALKKISFKSQ